jgi:ATP-dependent DNA helicase RecG
VDVVYFPKSEGESEFLEYPRITGPVPTLIRKTLDLLKTNFLKEKVIKQADKAEVIRIWNYPYAALEEAVANALFHRDYQLGSRLKSGFHRNPSYCLIMVALIALSVRKILSAAE